MRLCFLDQLPQTAASEPVLKRHAPSRPSVSVSHKATMKMHRYANGHNIRVWPRKRRSLEYQGWYVLSQSSGHYDHLQLDALSFSAGA